MGEEHEWRQLALQEYEYHVAAIHNWTGHRLTVRNWSITVAGAMFAVALSADEPFFAFGSVVSTLLFAWVELNFVRIQSGVIRRNNHIEVLLNNFQRSNTPPDYQFGVSNGYGRGNLLPWRGLWKGRWHICGYYVFLLTASLVGSTLLVLFR